MTPAIITKSSSDLPYEPLYTGPASAELPLPGDFPYTRGIHKGMYRDKLWTMRQYAGFGDAKSTNERFRYLLAQGQTGLSVAFDLPTQMGYDSDDALALGEVGRTGVAIDSLADMEALFDGIPLDKVSTSMTINAPAAILLAMYIAVGEKQGVPAAALTGTIQNDILKEYIARNTYIFPPAPSLRLIVDTCEFCAEHVPKWNTLSISGYHIREAGSTAAQEIGFTLANGLAYLEAAKQRGLDMDAIAPRLSFFFSAMPTLFEEVAKFRAARQLWAKLTKERLGCKNPKSWLLRFHVQTAGSSLTAQQIETNIVRTTIEALAAVLGGAQSLHTNAHDEALALPSADGARTALRIQQLVAYESDVPAIADPLGGSYAVEGMTQAIAEQAMAYIETIDEMGGALKALEAGYQIREIQETAYRTQRAIEQGTQMVVGVNCFTIEETQPVTLATVDQALESQQVERLQAIRAERPDVAPALERLRLAALGTDNLMPFILDAVRQYATVGEICRQLRGTWGQYRSHEAF
ncbi:MAG: methylmalonyl-CoA mutase [Candidatus Sericytochromatia bacterium]|nr:methylmalonyl-CoA mutase [Candidatus Sericytochromatia bacterium]